MGVSMNNAKYASWFSFAAGTLLITMLAISLKAGVTQQEFEFVKPAAVYRDGLLHFATPLRMILSFDNLFIVAYVLGTFFFCRVLREANSDGSLLNATLTMVITGGLLDLAENLHILAMLSGAEQGILPTDNQIVLQATCSAVKWHLAYAAFLVIGVAMRPRSGVEKMFAFSLIALQMPIGILVYTVSGKELSQVLQIARYANLLAGFFLIAWLTSRMSVRQKLRFKDQSNG